MKVEGPSWVHQLHSQISYMQFRYLSKHETSSQCLHKAGPAATLVQWLVSAVITCERWVFVRLSQLKLTCHLKAKEMDKMYSNCEDLNCNDF